MATEAYLQQEVERREADLRLAKAEVKAARLEVRLLTARHAQAQATIFQPVPEPRTIRPADPDIERFQAELDAIMKV